MASIKQTKEDIRQQQIQEWKRRTGGEKRTDSEIRNPARNSKRNATEIIKGL